MKKRTIVAGVILFAVITGLIFTYNHFDQKNVGENTLKLSLDTVFDSLDPAIVYSDDALVVSGQVLEPLFQYHYLKRPYEIQPLLAESMPQIENKGLIYKIKIKKNVKYHAHPAWKNEERTLKAQDFVTQFKRLTLDDLKSPGKNLFAGLIKGFDNYSNVINNDWRKIPEHDIEGIKVIDDHTLFFHLKRAEPNFIYFLALNFIVPIPYELIEYTKNDLNETLVGTGPYYFANKSNDYFELKKFKNYRQDFYPSSGDRYANVERLLDSSKKVIPFIDNVRFYITKEEATRWDMFLNRELDLLTVPKPFISKLYDKKGNLSKDLKNREVSLKHFPTLANRWLAFNMRHPLVGKNDFLRRAIAFGIDYSEYVKVISQNTNLRANSLLVPGISGYLPAKDFRFRYDPSLALEYLKLAGFESPEDMPTIVYSTRGNQGIHLVEANFIKESLEKIGLKVKIEILSFPEFLTKGRAGELMFFTDNWWFDYPDGENILQLLVSKNFPGINKSGYSNPKIDALYEDLKKTTNLDQRDKIIQQMEDIVFEDLPWIPMMYESSFVIQYPKIKNFRKSSIIRNFVKYLKIEN